MNINKKLISVFVCAALVGCGVSMPIKNVDNAPVTTTSSQNVGEDSVRQAIIRAGSTLGWQVRDAGPNKLIATLNIRTHQAVVEIPYTAKNYSIKYVSSINLNERDGSIHKNYNGWISNLTRDIDTQLANR